MRDVARPIRTPVPRGIARSGPPILSYGFRPFFLLAVIFALLDMVLWIGALGGAWSVGGASGPVAWHAHEMLFGYGAAALCGFVLTAVPNWTGRLPVSGRPLLGLAALWLAGRLVELFPGLLGDGASALLDALFLPALALVVAREVIAGRNAQNLRVTAGIGALALLNVGFHVAGLMGWGHDGIVRATVGTFSLLICHIGGRIIPSFTRNYLARSGYTRMPSPVTRFDHLSLALLLAATIAWVIAPVSWLTAILAGAVALSQAVRLARWRSLPSLREPILAMLHIGFAFIPLGWLGVALAGLDLVSGISALHVLTVGGIGLMTMAVMARATRGHTGRPVVASRITIVAFALLAAAAILRPAADLIPMGREVALEVSAAAWILAFALFLSEHGPMLVRPSRPRP